jgi:hypothetical protein
LGLEPEVELLLPNLASEGVKLWCIINRSTTIDLAEAALRRSLLITIGGTRPVVTSVQVLEAVAASFSINLASLAISRAAPEDFLLTLPDTGAADRVLNGGAPLHGPGFFLLFKRWTKLALTEVVVLPVSVDVELRGIPAHAWEVSTTQQILGSLC